MEESAKSEGSDDAGEEAEGDEGRGGEGQQGLLHDGLAKAPMAGDGWRRLGGCSGSGALGQGRRE